MTTKRGDSGKMHHQKVTGNALVTAGKRTEDAEITFFGASYCPFAQRAWTTLEYLQLPYRFLEVDPYSKPPELLEVSPKGLVPGLKLKNGGSPLGLNESMVIVDYLDSVAKTETGRSLFPTNPYAAALLRLAADHINRTLIPAFYKFWIAQEPEAQAERGKEFTAAIQTLVQLLERGEKETKLEAFGGGLWREGGELNYVDVIAAPFLFRSQLCLTYYRDWEMPSDPKFKAYTERLFSHPAFKATCSTDELYLDSDEQYAFNRSRSQVSKAINSGTALP